MPRAEDLAPLTGYENQTTEGKLRKRAAHEGKGGDWKKWRMIHNLQVKEVTRTWSSTTQVDIPPLKVTSIVPVGMVGCAEKVFTASSRNFTTLL